MSSPRSASRARAGSRSPFADVEGPARQGITGSAANAGGADRLGELIRVVADGTIRAPEVTTFSLSDAAEALGQQGTRHVRGKLVILLD